MHQHQKRHPNLQELFVKMDNLLRSLEGGKMQVKREGRVRDSGRIKGVNIDYSISLKTLIDNNSCIKDLRKNKNEEQQEVSRWE